MSGATLRRLGTGLLLALLVAVIEIRFAQPIADSDLFWHFAYARQMLEGHTLVPDPTLYSWTPTSTATIYCAWLAELVLYGLWSAFGLPGLFALRYLVVFAIAALYWSTLQRARLATSPVTLLATLVLVVTAYPGSLLKPELFSLLFFHTALYCYFRAKFAARAGGDPRPWLYAVPALTLLWANTHGAFVLLAPLLLATAFGEGLSRRFAPAIALSRSQLAHLLGAWALCALAVCLTPYGVAYPLQHLAELVAGGAARPDTVWNTAYQPIYAQGAAQLLSQPQLFAALGLACLAAFALAGRRLGRGGRIDCGVLLALVATLPLSVLVSRASYVWPALACYALAWLAGLASSDCGSGSKAAPARRWPAALATLAFLALAARVIDNAYHNPELGSWVGFGIGYSNPVPEAEFLAGAGLGPRFYNTFDSGGYLLWRLYPGYRVMVDPRSFPYLDWFEDQYAFANGRNFEAFLARYPADLAVIDLLKDACWRNFARARDWRLLFYGPTAAVFARRADSALVPQSAAALLELRNARTAFTAFDFATAVGDLPMAWRILAQLETTLVGQADPARLERARAYRAAHLHAPLAAPAP